nr:FP [Darna trima granulovirus]
MQQQSSPHYRINSCVEIFGLGEWDDYDACLQTLCRVLNLDYNNVQNYTIKNNCLLVKLTDEKTVNEWERKSREKRVMLSDVFKDKGQSKIKIFAAAPTKFKLLLHKVRKNLPEFKYIWIGKKGVMARHKSRTQIHTIKHDEDLDYIKESYFVV